MFDTEIILLHFREKSSEYLNDENKVLLEQLRRADFQVGRAIQKDRMRGRLARAFELHGGYRRAVAEGLVGVIGRVFAHEHGTVGRVAGEERLVGPAEDDA